MSGPQARQTLALNKLKKKTPLRSMVPKRFHGGIGNRLAYVLQERVKWAGVRQGSHGKRRVLEGQNVRLKDVAYSEGIEEKQLRRELSLNKLIEPGQSVGRAGQSKDPRKVLVNRQPSTVDRIR